MQNERAVPVAAPDRNGMQAFRGFKLPDPPRQVSLIVPQARVDVIDRFS
jgi:hypothetical protein